MLEIIQNSKGMILALALAGLAGLSVRIMLTVIKQRWASTFHHTMSYVLLPLITFTITKVITGNIALSLGMIGALSIVRFRNPVKNPFELVVFFALVTIGIAMASKIEYGVLLTLVINAVILASYIIEHIARRFNLNIYSLSFDEGNSFNIMEVTSNAEIPFLNQNEYLQQYVYEKSNNTRHYRLATRKNDGTFDELRTMLELEDAVLHVSTRYS